MTAHAILSALIFGAMLGVSLYFLRRPPRRYRRPDALQRYVDPAGAVWTASQAIYLNVPPCSRCGEAVASLDVHWRCGRELMHWRCADARPTEDRP